MPQQRGDNSAGAPLPQEQPYGYDPQHGHQDQGGNQQYY
jgi:hypothetical protein